MSVHQTAAGNWYCQYRVKGQKSPEKEYFGTGKEARRKAEARDAEVRMLRKKRQPVEPVRDARSVYIDLLAQSYLVDAKTRGKSERWRAELAHLLNEKLLPRLTTKPVGSLTYTDIIEVVDALWGDRSVATRQRYLGYLRAIFRYGTDHGITTSNPLAKWKKARERKRDVKLTVDDLTRIMENAEPHLAWAIEVEWELGTRPGTSELLSLLWTDVDWDAGTIHVRGTKTEESDRILPITAHFQARLAFMRTHAKTDHLVEYKGQPIKKLRRSLGTAARRAGITYNVRMYDIRHLFASIMLAGGGDLAAVSRMLGHADISTTQKHYYHLLKGEMERATSLRPSIRKKTSGKVTRIA